MKTVVVLGKSRLAIRLCEWLLDQSEFCLAAIVPCRPYPEWTEDLNAWARRSGVPLVESGEIDDLHASQLDLAVSCYYNKILRQPQIDRFELALNIHNSALPRHRGVGPIEWSMRDGTGIQGITVHEIAEGADTGPIFGQLCFKIWPWMDSHQIHGLCLDYGFSLLTSVLMHLDAITPETQNEQYASYHTRLETALMLGNDERRLLV